MDHFKLKSGASVFLDGSLSKTFRVRTYTNGKVRSRIILVQNNFF